MYCFKLEFRKPFHTELYFTFTVNSCWYCVLVENILLVVWPVGGTGIALFPKVKWLAVNLI